MKQENPTQRTSEFRTLLDKKAYNYPEIRVYGALHLVTQGTGGNGADGTTNMTKMSDCMSKEHIVKIGVHPLGIGLYLFDYKPEYRELSGHGRQFGVMADEVETVMPEAVSLHADGYKMVNYAMLGISQSIQ